MNELKNIELMNINTALRLGLITITEALNLYSKLNNKKEE